MSNLYDAVQDLQRSATHQLKTICDYYDDSILAWEIVLRVIHQGNHISNINLQTGEISVEQNLINKSRLYTTVLLAESTFPQLISVFEIFLFDLITLWLQYKPELMRIENTKADRKIDFEEIYKAQSREELLASIARKIATDTTYLQPSKWFQQLNKYLKTATVSEPQIEEFIEAKASRDLLVHNQGIVNQIYLDKAETKARFQMDQKISIDSDYYFAVYRLLNNMIETICKAACIQIQT